MFFLAYHSKKIVLLRKDKNLLSIEHLRIFNTNVKPLYILKPILHGKRFALITGLESREVLLRSISLKLKSKREILAALPFQVESLLPYSPEELLLLPTLYPEKNRTEVSLLASSINTLKHHLKEAGSLDLDPDIVSCVPLALFRFARHFFPKNLSLFIHHATADQATFVVVRGGKLIAAQSYKSQEFERTLAYMQKKYPDIEQMLCTGTSAPTTPFNYLNLETPNIAEYAIPIGLALDAAKNDTQSGQFRQSGLIGNKQKKQKRKQLTIFLSGCASFIFISLFLGQILLKKQEHTALRSIGFPESERLHKVVEKLEHDLYQQKKSSTSTSCAPKVYEVLHWLSTHPNLNANCSITNFRYLLTTPSKLGAKSKISDLKIELEIAIPNSSIARTFHEALLKESTIINQKKPIQWKAHHGIYHVSFYLKPKSGR